MSVSIADFKKVEERVLAGNRAFTAGGIAIHGTNTENVLTANTVNFSIDGVLYTKAAQTELDLSGVGVITSEGVASAATALATGYARVYLLVLNASGTNKIIEGATVANGTSVYVPSAPESGYAPYAAVKVVNASGSNFTFGTTDLDASGITDSYFDLSAVPVGAV